MFSEAVIWVASEQFGSHISDFRYMYFPFFIGLNV